MPTRRQLIQKIELNSNASSVTFSNIPQNYTDLKIVYSSRVASSGNSFIIKMWVNGATSDTNHSCRELYGEGSGSGGSRSLSYLSVGWSQGTSATANTFANAEIYIPNYAGSSNKTFSSKSVTENNGAYAAATAVAGLWSNTSAISSLTLFPTASAPFAANSTFYLYGITHVPIIRGGEVEVRDGFKYHTFTSAGTLQVIEPGDIEYLIVAGGGGPGLGRGGGGGAGGLLTGKARLNKGNFSAVIGAGGPGGQSNVDNGRGTSGSNSTFIGLTSIGGGAGGGSFGQSLKPGLSGGSGGGAGYDSNSDVSGGSGTSGQGFNGGNEGGSFAGGGGGGAGAAGQNGAVSGTRFGGNGGIGKIWPDGSSYYYAGGGGGAGAPTGGGGLGGYGGGGQGGMEDIFYGASNGQPNTGGGGGGGYISGSPSTSANGGSGIVIIRYPYDGN